MSRGHQTNAIITNASSDFNQSPQQKRISNDAIVGAQIQKTWDLKMAIEQKRRMDFLWTILILID